MLANLARMSTATTGTGAITLGSAVSGHLTFAQAGIVDGDVVTYAIEDGSNSEIGVGTYTASGTTLSRTTIYNSTNSNNAINLSGTAEVFITAAAQDLYAGALYPKFTRPRDADFAWINQGGASVTVNANGGIYLDAPAAGSINLRVRKKAAPSTPYTITAAFLLNLVTEAETAAGLVFRQASDGKLITYFINRGSSNSMLSQDMGSATSFSGSNAALTFIDGVGSVIWLQISDNGTNRIMRWSMDGYNFTQFFSEGRTTFLTATEVGYYANSSHASAPASCTLLSWAQT